MNLLLYLLEVTRPRPIPIHRPEVPTPRPKAEPDFYLSNMTFTLDGTDENLQYYGKGLLHRCMGAGSELNAETTIRLLYQHGADPNVRDKKGRTCLAKAVTGKWDISWCCRDSLKTAELIVNTYHPRADLESQDLSGYTPLHRATMSAVTLFGSSNPSKGCEAIVRQLFGFC